MDGPSRVMAFERDLDAVLNLTAHGDQSFDYALSEYAATGTEIIYYTFAGATYEYPVDIDTYKAYFISVDHDKMKYYPQDEVNSEVVVWVNHDFHGYLEGYLEKPDGMEYLIFSGEKDLYKGNNLYLLSGDLSTEFMGKHKIHYKLFRDPYRNKALASIESTIDVGNFAVKSLATDALNYEFGYDDAYISVFLWGEGFSGEFILLLDGETIFNETMTLDGDTFRNVIIPETDLELLSDYNLSAMMIASDATSLLATSFWVVDTIPPDIEIAGVEPEELTNDILYPETCAYDLNLAGIKTVLNDIDFINGSSISEDGDYLLKAWAWDTSFNYSDEEIRFTIDRTPPWVLIPIVNGSYSRLPLVFSVNVHDEHRDHLSETVHIVFDGNDWPELNVDEDISLQDEGAYSVYGYASDLAGNTSSADKTIILDFTPPVIEITGYLTGQYYNSDVNVAMTVSDIHRFPDGEALSVNGMEYPIESANTFSWDGTYEVTGFAEDLAGNTTGVPSVPT